LKEFETTYNVEKILFPLFITNGKSQSCPQTKVLELLQFTNYIIFIHVLCIVVNQSIGTFELYEFFTFAHASCIALK